jgi:hypothetical protein
MPYTPLDLAAALIQTGELADALAALNQHLAQQPQDDRARRLRAGVLKHLGGDDQLRAALADLEQLTDPTAGDAIQQSILLEQAGDPAGAQAILAQAHARWPDDERLTERFLSLLLAQNQAETALAVVREQTQTWRWLQWEGDVLTALGDDVTATARYGLALAQLEGLIQPDNARYFGPIKARLLLARAAAYHRLNLPDQADAHYEAAGQIIPDDPTIGYNRGLLAWERGDHDAAVHMCRTALAAASESLRARLLADLRDDARYTRLWNTLRR